MAPAASTTRRRERVTQPSAADRPADLDRALELDVHARRDAPVVLGDQRPGHDLVEDRADDAAVRDTVPALEAAVERELGPRPPALHVQVQLEAAVLSVPHAKQLCGANSNAGCVVERGDPDLRRQDSAPCGPRS